MLRQASTCLSCPLSPKMRLQIAQIAIDSSRMTHDEARHEAIHRIVDLAFLGDGEARAATVGGQVVNPSPAKGQRLVRDSVDDPLVRNHTVGLEEQAAVRADLAETWMCAVGWQHLDPLHRFPPLRKLFHFGDGEE